MHISFASLLTVAALVGAVSAGSKHHKKEHHHHGHKPHHPVAPKGKAFDHILQIWFENQVRTFKTKHFVHMLMKYSNRIMTLLPRFLDLPIF